MNFPNEFRAMEQFCRDRLPGVRRLADRQKTCAALDPPQQHRQNPNPHQNQRDFYRDKGNGRNSEYDRKRELYKVTSAAVGVSAAGQSVSPPKNEAVGAKLNPEAHPFHNNKCEFPNCNSQPSSHFLAKCPTFKSKPVSERQKYVTAKNLCNVCFRKVHTHMSQCRLLEVVKRLNRKVCDINGCSLQHSFLLHPDQGKASVNMLTVLEEEDMDEEEPASEDDEEEDDQSPRARLMRGILQAGRPVQDDQPPEDDPEGPEEAVKEPEAVLEEEERLEPEKEKNTPSHVKEEHLDYCSMEAIAERWKSIEQAQEVWGSLRQSRG